MLSGHEIPNIVPGDTDEVADISASFASRSA